MLERQQPLAADRGTGHVRRRPCRGAPADPAPAADRRVARRSARAAVRSQAVPRRPGLQDWRGRRRPAAGRSVTSARRSGRAAGW